jgi:single-stranded DNA-binding protein
MNNVNFYGMLDSEPELLGMPGRDVCEFWLAVQGRTKSQTLDIRVVAFQGRALQIAEELSKGDRVVLSGRLRSERWPGRRRMFRHSVILADLRKVGGRPRREADEHDQS